jgi:hypothetical protein
MTNITTPRPGASQPKEPVRLIDADEVMNAVFNAIDIDEKQWNEIKQEVDEIPTIDPESLRPTAHWDIKETDCRDVILCWRCDKCGRLSRDDYPYCPHCGKRMVNENESL